MILLHPGYFNPIIHYVTILQSPDCKLEVEDNFQKQTYRTRSYIYSPNGKQLLNVPIQRDKNKTSKTKTKDILIDYENENWRTNHLKSLQTAYRSSPYFEFYEDDIKAVFDKKHKYLLDLNLATQEFILDALQEESCILNKTTEYHFIEEEIFDYRTLINAKKDIPFLLKPYTQMFDEKHGFIENLSILDLLFMQGPSASIYLLKQEI